MFEKLEIGELWSGYVKNVVDGDTVDIHFNICGVQRLRLVGIDAPEIGEEGYAEVMYIPPSGFDCREWKG